jgi:DNA modification methylase
LKELPDECVDSVITSPPYYGLRSYEVDGQIGQEKTPAEYVAKMLAVFEQIKRVLKKTGTLWLNLGDSYTAGGNGGHGAKQHSNRGTRLLAGHPKNAPAGFKPKNLLGIPWRVAFALQESGWYLRQDIIWSKPNPMPESVQDRCTRAHEYIFMFSRCPKYFYDANSIRTVAKNPLDDNRRLLQQKATNKSIPTGLQNGLRLRDKQRGHSRRHAGFNDRLDNMKKEDQLSRGANKRSVWTVAPANFREAHFATFPEELVQPMILAGCPAGGGLS